MYLDEDEFLKVVAGTPLVSIDLAIRNADQGLLVGLRQNEPAKATWFVPGGRIRKDEAIDEAFRRITDAELGFELEFNSAKLIDAFTHRYETNFAGARSISTHYVVLAYEVSADLDLSILPAGEDAQHTEWKWVASATEGPVHPNVEPYFC